MKILREHPQVVHLMLAAGLGVAISMLIAWIAAFVHDGPRRTDGLSMLEVGRGGWGHETFAVTCVQVLDEEYMLQSAGQAAQLGQPFVLAGAFDVAAESRRAQGVPAMKSEYVYAFGWPLRCLWYHAQGATDLSGVGLAAEDIGVELGAPAGATTAAAQPTVIPLRPLWLGMLGNVLVFGAPAFVLLSIPGMIRTSRRRHNRCETCGYPRRGLHSRRCPECGHAGGIAPALA